MLAGGIVGDTAQYLLWGAAFVFEWATPKLINDRGFEIGPAHFVERHGLVVIVAIGESVVALGIGVAHQPVDAPLAAVALVGLVLSACLWWAYFGGDDARAEHALANAPPASRPALAINAFGYWHLPILLGVIIIAASVKNAVEHAFDPLPAHEALALAGGVTLFMLGDVVFRRSLGLRRNLWRTLIAALALATPPLGITISVTAQLSTLAALLAAGLGAETATRPAEKTGWASRQ